MSNSSKKFLKYLKKREEETGSRYSALRDILTDVMHACQDDDLDFDTMLRSAIEVFEEEAELCGEFLHDDAEEGLIICMELAGTEHSHHDGQEYLKHRKATPEEEAACRKLWKENENAVVHLKDGKVVDITK